MERYYRILGLDPGATEAQIKKAYRKMAMRYHPDKASGSKEKFLQILTAYEILSGVRQAKQEQKKTDVKGEDFAQFYEILKKAAEEKAKARYRERAAKIRRERAAAQGRAYQQGLLSLVVIVILAGLVYWSYPLVINHVIEQDPLEDYAEITGIANRRVFYRFSTPEGSFEDEAYVRKVGLRMVGEAGLPLAVGDRVLVRYRASNPSYNQLLFKRVEKNTLQRYLLLSQKQLMALEVVGSERPLAQASCLTLLLYQKFGLDGLATVIFAEEHPLENWNHNYYSWKRLQEKPAYQEIASICATRFEGPAN